MSSLSNCFTTPPKLHLFHSRALSSTSETTPCRRRRRSTPYSFRTSSVPPSPAVSVRASSFFDATAKTAAGIRPGGAVESDKLQKEVRNRAMDAIEACGGRVTVGDVASRAGLKLNEAQKALQALAADTEGFLEVLKKL